jgi:hypothetical protein
MSLTITNISLSNVTISFVPPPVGQIEFTTPGTYSWTAPINVYSVCVVCVGGGASGGNYFQYKGAGGGGGALVYGNDIPVTPTQTV